MNFYRRFGKRLSDVVLALAGFCVLWPIFVIIAVLVKTSSRGPIFFRQVRTGRHTRPFRILKFRTMVDAAYPLEAITVADDTRLTRLGWFLRTSKLDELPQLWNVICGEMSIVGPRPELEYFVLQGYSDEERRVIFSVRPGLTDSFAIRSIDEEEIPANQARPVDYYQQIVLPAKIKRHLEYVKAISLRHDVQLMMATSLAMIRRPFRRASCDRIDMDKVLRRDILQWDVRNWSKALEFWENNTDWSKVHDCLELGASAGGISLWLALKGRSVTCSDVDDSQLVTRRQLHASYNVAEAIHYANVDAVEIPYRHQFDLIVLKSVLGGVRTSPNKQTLQRVVDGIYQALRPGGQFLFAENTNASLLHQYFRGKLGRHQSWRYVSVDEIREFLREYSSFELQTAGVAATFGRTEGQRTVLSNLDSLVLERICPPSWRYLAYGVATK